MMTNLKTKLKLETLRLTSALLFAGGTLFGQSVSQIEGTATTAASNSDARMEMVIFSNLGPASDGKFDSNPVDALAVAGRAVKATRAEKFYLDTETAIRFAPNVDVQATVLKAAINYTSERVW